MKEFATENAGRKFLTRKQYDSALYAIEAIRSRQHLVQIIDRCDKEVTLRGNLFGIPAKGRCDLIDVPHGEIIDLKTVASCEKYAFGRSFVNLNIAFKMSIYRELARQQYGREFQCSIICQETGGDFDNTYVPIPGIVLDNAFRDSDSGRKSVEWVCKKYLECQETGNWPGVDGGALIYDLVIPNWAMSDDTELDWGDAVESEYQTEDAF
jgi:hypothetical protein